MLLGLWRTLDHPSVIPVTLHPEVNWFSLYASKKWCIRSNEPRGLRVVNIQFIATGANLAVLSSTATCRLVCGRVILLFVFNMNALGFSDGSVACSHYDYKKHYVLRSHPTQRNRTSSYYTLKLVVWH